jgi:hypothetical protein
MHVHVLSLYLQEEFNLKVFGDNNDAQFFFGDNNDAQFLLTGYVRVMLTPWELLYISTCFFFHVLK